MLTGAERTGPALDLPPGHGPAWIVASDGRVSFRLLGPVEALDAAGGAAGTRAGRDDGRCSPPCCCTVGRASRWTGWWNCCGRTATPATAATMVHGAVVALRRSLEEGGRPRLLLTRDGGYALDLAAEQVDAARFEQALERGPPRTRRVPRRTARLVARALAEWRGPALAGDRGALRPGGRPASRGVARPGAGAPGRRGAAVGPPPRGPRRDRGPRRGVPAARGSVRSPGTRAVPLRTAGRRARGSPTAAGERSSTSWASSPTRPCGISSWRCSATIRRSGRRRSSPGHAPGAARLPRGAGAARSRRSARWSARTGS